MPVLDQAGYPQSGNNRTRATVRAEMADYSGGGKQPDIQAKVDRAWDAAVREFNSVPWAFNRQVQDILIDSNMKDNTTAPTVTNTGVLTGFTLDTGLKIVYWIEERVKVGNQIVRRNDENGQHTVTLTGTGAATTAVITRPAQLNPDATHWALFGTGIGNVNISNAWPDGSELAETVIANTTLEDPRVGFNPGIKGEPIYRSGFYDLNTNVRNPVKAFMVDPQGRERISVVFIPYRQYAIMLTRVATASRPLFYTLRNRYRTGQVIFHPRPATQNLWPIVRLIYDSPINLAGSDPGSQLDVPMEVDEAIFQRATAIFLHRLKGPEAVVGLDAAKKDFDLRQQVEAEYRDYEDI